MSDSLSSLDPRPGEKFFEEKDYAKVRALRKEGQLDKAEKLLLKAVPVPAVVDELRKTASAKAKLAKKAGDWAAVHRHLQGYLDYADKVAARTFAMSQQEPEDHTDTDCRLLEEAKARLAITPQQ